MNKIEQINLNNGSFRLEYKYEFQTGCPIENANEFMGYDVRQDLYDVLLEDFKLELYSKIFKKDKLELLEIKHL